MIPEPTQHDGIRSAGSDLLMYSLRIATWNLNHRIGKTRFRPEAADAAIAINADVFVFTEFFPRGFEGSFRGTLDSGGWSNQEISRPSLVEPANRVLIVSRLPMTPLTINLPDFDHQFPANLLAVRFPCLGLSVLGVRVPWYEKSTKKWHSAWDWLEGAAVSLNNGPSIIIGDLNVTTTRTSRGRKHFKRILASGWQGAMPFGTATYFHAGRKSEVDHILATNHCILSDAECVQEAGGFVLADGSPAAISDHALLVCRVGLLPEDRTGGGN